MRGTWRSVDVQTSLHPVPCWNQEQVHQEQRVADVRDEERLVEAQVVVDELQRKESACPSIHYSILRMTPVAHPVQQRYSGRGLYLHQH